MLGSQIFVGKVTGHLDRQPTLNVTTYRYTDSIFLLRNSTSQLQDLEIWLRIM